MIKVMDVQPIGWLARMGDILMVPIMHLISILAGARGEKPQRTHAWNVQRLTGSAAKRLRESGRVNCQGVAGALERRHWWDLILFHLPFLKKGWRQYVVLSPDCTWDGTGLKWHVGWITSDAKIEISKIPIVWSVRMLLGPDDVSFFGIGETGCQIPIFKVGEGRIGDGGPFSKAPLC